ncbi:MAG: leucyl/phenylalanyl-tRNA--protein transferase [Gammaproteobacteria bacterium]|nr:leucyl/phenylalanyl-tRNA--protein transferase [Gammaproteobacteria bacterium]
MSTSSSELAFPNVENALEEPNGLLAVGGDLSAERLLIAYRSGIFPWFSEDEPIMWWSPNPRCVLFPEQLHINKSLRKAILNADIQIKHNTAFRRVMEHCAAPRKQQNGTWILPDMIEAYCSLNKKGKAHSIECWRDESLIGGLYGVAIGKVFFGESMFSLESNASKIALVSLAQSGRWSLIDCQQPSDHLQKLGATEIPRKEFIKLLAKHC